MSKEQSAATESTPVKATKKAPAGTQSATGAPAKGKPTKKPKKAKEPKQSKQRKDAATTKSAQVLALLKRKGGATVQEIMAATEWQPHTVRGFLAGTVRKKLGLTVTSTKAEGGKRTYVIEA